MAIATGISPQAMATRGIQFRRKKPRYSDYLASQYGQATQSVVARKEKEQLQAQQEFENRQAIDQMKLQKQQFGFQQKQAKQQAKYAKFGMGIQGAQLGLNILDTMAPTLLPKIGSGIGKSWLGQGIKSIGSSIFGPIGGAISSIF